MFSSPQAEDDSGTVFIKIIVVGEKGTGKSEFLSKWIDNEARILKSVFTNISSPGPKKSDVFEVEMEIKHRNVRVSFHVHNRFDRSYEASNNDDRLVGDVFMIFFDVTSHKSLGSVTGKWAGLLKLGTLSKNIPIILVGNKEDLKSNVKILESLRRGRRYSHPISLEDVYESCCEIIKPYGYFETSALNNVKVQETMDETILCALRGKLKSKFSLFGKHKRKSFWKSKKNIKKARQEVESKLLAIIKNEKSEMKKLYEEHYHLLPYDVVKKILTEFVIIEFPYLYEERCEFIQYGEKVKKHLGSWRKPGAYESEKVEYLFKFYGFFKTERSNVFQCFYNFAVKSCDVHLIPRLLRCAYIITGDKYRRYEREWAGKDYRSYYGHVTYRFDWNYSRNLELREILNCPCQELQKLGKLPFRISTPYEKSLQKLFISGDLNITDCNVINSYSNVEHLRINAFEIRGDLKLPKLKYLSVYRCFAKGMTYKFHPELETLGIQVKGHSHHHRVSSHLNSNQFETVLQMLPKLKKIVLTRIDCTDLMLPKLFYKENIEEIVIQGGFKCSVFDVEWERVKKLKKLTVNETSGAWKFNKTRYPENFVKKATKFLKEYVIKSTLEEYNSKNKTQKTTT